MAVAVPRYGVAVVYTNGAETVYWFATQQVRDKKHDKLNKDKNVRTARRVDR